MTFNTFNKSCQHCQQLVAKKNGLKSLLNRQEIYLNLEQGANKCAESVSRGATRFTYNHLMRLFSAKESVRVNRTNKIRD